jgi:hypothetical protein
MLEQRVQVLTAASAVEVSQQAWSQQTPSKPLGAACATQPWL